MISGSLSARSLSIGYLRRGGLDIPVTDLMVDAGNLVLEYREIILNKQNSGEGLDSTPAQMRLLGQSAGW